MSDTTGPEPITQWVRARDGDALWLNATGVAVGGAGILLLGASGSGKSTLALDLIALGASLIADDGVWITPSSEGPVIERPAQAVDLLEMRGIGLLRPGAITPAAPLALAVDLVRSEAERLPPRRLVAIGAHTRPLILGAGRRSLPAALSIMARHGRAEP